MVVGFLCGGANHVANRDGDDVDDGFGERHV